MAVYQPHYKVNRNRQTGKVSVTIGKDTYPISKVQNGGTRFYYCHYKGGRQSQLYPTQRDCLNNIIYGV